MEKALEELRQKSLSMVAENLEYFNCCKKEFAVSECKLWLNKIFDRVNEEIEEAMKPKTCEGCKFRNTVKFVQVESETLECCSVCVRNCYDYYEPKDNA